MKVTDHTAITCEEWLPRLTKRALLCRQAKKIADVCLLRCVVDTPDRVFFTTDGELTGAFGFTRKLWQTTCAENAIPVGAKAIQRDQLLHCNELATRR